MGFPRRFLRPSMPTTGWSQLYSRGRKWIQSVSGVVASLARPGGSVTGLSLQATDTRRETHPSLYASRS